MKTRKLLSLILSFSMIMSLAIGVNNVSASESTDEYTLIASGSGFSGTNDGNLTRMIAGAGVQWAGLSGLNNTLTKAAKDNGQIVEIEFTVYRPDYTDSAKISLNQTNGWGPTLEILPYGIRLVNGSVYAKSSYNSNAYCYAGGATKNKIIWKFDLESMKQRIDVEDCFDNAGHRTSATTDWVDIGTGSYGWIKDSWTGIASPVGSGSSIVLQNAKWRILDFSEFSCELKGIDTVTSFSDLVAKATQTVKIKADYVNTTGEQKQVYLIVAYYSDANQLVYTDWIVIDSKNAAGYDYLVPAVNGATNAKVFAWDGLDTITPLSTCLNFE